MNLIKAQNRIVAFESLKVNEFKHLIQARFVIIGALRMLGTLVGWWVYELTNDPFAIGLVGLSEVIPAISMALYSGHKVDISEKRMLLIKCVISYTLVVLFLLVMALLFKNEMVKSSILLLSIYSLIFCSGVIRSFMGPTFSALVGTIVPTHLLPNATTLSQGSWLVASVAGHAICGFSIYKIGISGTLVFIIALMLIGSFFVFKIKAKPILNKAGDKPTWESVKEGLRFVYSTKELLGSMAVDMFAVLFGGVVALIPVFAKDILKVGSIGFGWLNAASDIGAAITIITFAFYPLKKKQGIKLILAVTGFGICIIAFALSKWFFVSFIILLISGLLDGVSMLVRGTIMQLKTPNHMRGRVSSVSSMFINSSNELGQFESGLAAKLFGVVPSVIFGGCMTLGVALFTWFKAPTLRKFEY